MADQFEIKEDTKRQKADGTWEQKIKICVKNGGAATAAATLWITSHPWDAKGKKIGTRRFDSVTFAVGDRCKEVVFEFPSEPKQRYTDLYKTRKPNGDFDGKIQYRVDFFAAVPIPPEQSGRAVLAVVMAMPYPFSLQQEALGTLSFSVTAVNNAAPWNIDFIVPNVGEVFTMEPMEKSIPLTVGLSTLEPIAEGYSHEISIEVVPLGGDEDPDGDGEVNFDTAIETAIHKLRIVKDTTAPMIVAHPPVIDHANSTASLSWTVSDNVSGVRTPHLRYSLDAGRTWKGCWPDLSTPVYEGETLVSGLYTAEILYCEARNIHHELIASDESLNTQSSGVVVTPM